jgi:hypothetical protein
VFGLDDRIASLSDGTTLLVVIVVAVFLGLRHATDPDHLAAVTTLVASARERRTRIAARLGLVWGAGHATSLFTFGLPIILYRAYLPDVVQRAAETSVGCMIVVLAAALLVRWHRGAFADDGGVARSARTPCQAYAIGLVHGAGGSAGVGILLLASIRDEALAVAALAAGVAVKYALAPLLGLYVLLVARRSVTRALALAVVAALVLGAALAPEWRSLTLRAVTPMIGGESARHAHSLTDLVCLALDALALPRASLVAYRALSLASALLCASLLLRAALSARTLEDLAHGYLLFLLALYLTAPWFQPWYVTWALPLLLVEPSAQWRRFVAVFSVVTVVQWAAPLDPVTTVAGDLWAAYRIWSLVRRDAREPAAYAA